MTNTAEKIIQQSGVVGMKWGIRRSRATLARARASGGGAFPKDHSKREEARIISKHTGSSKKKISELDTKELQELVNRLNLEKQYSSLVAGHQKADGFTKRLIKDIGKEQASRVAKAAVSVGVEQLIKKHGGANGEVIAKRLSPKKK